MCIFNASFNKCNPCSTCRPRPVCQPCCERPVCPCKPCCGRERPAGNDCCRTHKEEPLWCPIPKEEKKCEGIRFCARAVITLPRIGCCPCRRRFAEIEGEISRPFFN